LLRKTSIQELREHTHYNTLVSLSEKQLLLHLALFPEIVQTAADRYEVSLVARYAFELARLINSYYHHERILDDDIIVQKERLQLIDASKQVLSNALSLL
jgi:arginyl-tRNA synthetase